jgi:hypothetical protein
MPALLAVYATAPAEKRSLDIDPILMMLPPSLPKCFNASRHVIIVPHKLVSSILWSCSSVVSSSEAKANRLALFTRMSSGPNVRDGFGKQPLHLGDNGDIRLNRERLAACGVDLGDGALCARSVTGEVHDDGGTSG